MAYQSSAGIGKLAGVLDGRMQAQNASPLIVDFGDIGPNMELTTNTFPRAIPASDYSVCRSLTLGNVGAVLAQVTTSEGKGNALVPDLMRRLLPGDRVLVAWVQDEPVVIDLIRKAANI